MSKELGFIGRTFRDRAFMRKHKGICCSHPRFGVIMDEKSMKDEIKASLFLSGEKDKNTTLYRTASAEEFEEFFNKRLNHLY